MGNGSKKFTLLDKAIGTCLSAEHAKLLSFESNLISANLLFFFLRYLLLYIILKADIISHIKDKKHTCVYHYQTYLFFGGGVL